VPTTITIAADNAAAKTCVTTRMRINCVRVSNCLICAPSVVKRYSVYVSVTTLRCEGYQRFVPNCTKVLDLYSQI
jgi:hypothetical protein